jgi:hypothetical protein
MEGKVLHPLTTPVKRHPFATADIETTTDLKRVYLVGYYAGKAFKYWESEPLPPEHPGSAMTQFLRWYLARATHRHLYAHNGGNFDWVFALRCILDNFPEFTAEIIPSQSTILKLTITKQGESFKWVFLDSARTLPDKLDNLGKCFTGKGKVDFGGDYDTLPSNPLRYDYLRCDCILLYKVLETAFHKLEHDIGGRVSISAASTALATYRSSYQERDLPDAGEHANKLSRAAYYGGRCEVFRTSFKGSFEQPLNCFDVNSMYPWAMSQQMPIKVESEGRIDSHWCWENAVGFVDCTVEVNPCHIPVLPCRQDGKLIFPIGKWRGVFSSTELRLAAQLGQLKHFTVHDSVYFTTAPIFIDYVKELYWLRNKENPAYNEATAKIAKLLLNSLYGKFGSSEERETIHIRPTMDNILSRNLLPMPSPITSDCYLEKTKTDADYMLPHIAAWVTSLSRARLCRGLIEAGESAFYCDTDSIYTTGQVADCGPNLGQFKNEYPRDPICEATFIAPKVYTYRHASGKVTNRAKGFSRFGTGLPGDITARLAKGEAVQMSRFSKARSVIGGEFGLVNSSKRIYNLEPKRIFLADGTSTPRSVSL